MDFESPKKLAEYILKVDNDKELFNSYFKWKRHVQFFDYTVQYGFLCDMCIHLHLETFFGKKRKVIKDMGKYWDSNSQCTYPRIHNDQDFKYF